VIHELRTPMTSIIGFSKMLLAADGISPEAQRTFLETISRESVRLGKMVNDFLDLARLETRRTKLEKVPVDVNEVVSEVVTLLAPQAQEQQLSLTFEAAPDPFTVLGDRARLKQVMVNLIGNAVKYNKTHGSVQTRLKRNGQSGEVIITDTGLGIPEPALERIFDKFYRVIEHQTEKKGTGLGLSIAKEIIEAHGGSISVTSVANEGSTFTIELPLKTN
jgi:signal transduction histidine kinase